MESNINKRDERAVDQPPIKVSKRLIFVLFYELHFVKI